MRVSLMNPKNPGEMFNYNSLSIGALPIGAFLEIFLSQKAKEIIW